LRTRDKVIAAGSAAGAVASALAALAATACCAGPAVFALLGTSGAIAAAGLHPYRLYFGLGGLAFLSLGFWRAYGRRPASAQGASCSVRSGRWVRVLLWISLTLSVAAAILGFVIDRGGRS
jgi:mercuric ion transport protein